MSYVSSTPKAPIIYIYIYIYTDMTLHDVTLNIDLHYVALHCIALHCIALHCIALHCIALHCIHTSISSSSSSCFWGGGGAGVQVGFGSQVPPLSPIASDLRSSLGGAQITVDTWVKAPKDRCLRIGAARGCGSEVFAFRAGGLV